MDFTGIYELRDRLRVNMIAGANLLDEDFRLKKAIEACRPLQAAAPVFAKMLEQCDKLLAVDSKEKAVVLMDTISLVDAVVCTLQSTSAKEEAEEILLKNTDGLMLDVPYSVLHEVIAGLTETGSGRYETVKTAIKEKPEVFQDYRVLQSLVKGLKAPYAGTAELVYKMMLEDENALFLPLLKEDFNPKGGKDMQRRIRVIMRKEGAKANDFYLKWLPETEKDLRVEMIDALHYSEENYELLKTLVDTEKAKTKPVAMHSLSYFDTEEVVEIFEKMISKKSRDYIDAIKDKDNGVANRIIAKTFRKDLDLLIEDIAKYQEVTEMDRASKLVTNLITDLCALERKSSDEIFEVIKYGLDHTMELNPYLSHCTFNYNKVHSYRLDRYQSKDSAFSELCEILLRNTLYTGRKDMKQYMLERYEEKKEYDLFFPVVMLKILDGSFDRQWMESQEKYFVKQGITKEDIGNQMAVYCRHLDCKGTTFDLIFRVSDGVIPDGEHYAYGPIEYTYGLQELTISMSELHKWMIAFSHDTKKDEFDEFLYKTADLAKPDDLEAIKKIMHQKVLNGSNDDLYFRACHKWNLSRKGLALKFFKKGTNIYWYAMHDYMRKLRLTKEEYETEFDEIFQYHKEHEKEYKMKETDIQNLLHVLTENL